MRHLPVPGWHRRSRSRPKVRVAIAVAALSALALALVIGASVAGGSDQRPEARWPIAALSCTGAAFLWAAALIGLYVTARHPL